MVKSEKIEQIWSKISSKEYRPPLAFSVFLMLMSGVGGGLGGIFVYNSLYQIGKVDFFTMLGILMLVTGLAMIDLLMKSKKK